MGIDGRGRRTGTGTGAGTGTGMVGWWVVRRSLKFSTTHDAMDSTDPTYCRRFLGRQHELNGRTVDQRAAYQKSLLHTIVNDFRFPQCTFRQMFD